MSPLLTGSPQDPHPCQYFQGKPHQPESLSHSDLKPIAGTRRAECSCKQHLVCTTELLAQQGPRPASSLTHHTLTQPVSPSHPKAATPSHKPALGTTRCALPAPSPTRGGSSGKRNTAGMCQKLVCFGVYFGLRFGFGLDQT